MRNNLELETKALSFAAEAHKGQYRKFSNLPYIVHPMAAVNLLVLYVTNVTSEMIAAAYLHDVVEDTDVTLETIFKEFGNEVATKVAGMTKGQYPGANRKTRFKNEVDRLKACSEEVKTIKIADSYCNIRDYLSDDPDYARRIYIPEKRILLDEALKEGNNTIWMLTDQLIKENSTT